MKTWMDHPETIRLICFFTTLIGMALWEVFTPRRKLHFQKTTRWVTNLSLVALDTVFVRFLFPASLFSVAWVVEKKDMGWLQSLELSKSVLVIVSILLLDFVIYLQHVLFHTLPILWRLHRVHHADRDFDVTTGIRFHPIEIAISMGIKLIAISLLGVPPLSVLFFEVILNITSLFNHGNVKISPFLDRLLRIILVTPDMHRVHHSTILQETNSNFGFNLPIWDYLLGTYRAQPIRGHDQMEIGLSEFQESQVMRFSWALYSPFLSPKPKTRE